jgi:hypothetical protein
MTALGFIAVFLTVVAILAVGVAIEAALKYHSESEDDD